jgi:hypothetical protein
MKKISIQKKITYFDYLTLPLNYITFYFYKYLFRNLLIFYLTFGEKTAINIFFRQGLVSSPNSFNLFFSDVDVGIWVVDLKCVNSIKKKYYLLKKLFIFMGELEIYTKNEYQEIYQSDIVFLNLYLKIRTIRQINWLRSRILNEKNRTNYHRLKDHRKLIILTRKLKLTSSYNVLFSLKNDLEKFIQYNNSINNFSIYKKLDYAYCNYICQSFHFKKDINLSLFFLACLPIKKRGQLDLDLVIQQYRSSNIKINSLFKRLNEIEYYITQAYIRGSNKSEDWYDRWLLQLKEGFKNDAT